MKISTARTGVSLLSLACLSSAALQVTHVLFTSRLYVHAGDAAPRPRQPGNERHPLLDHSGQERAQQAVCRPSSTQANLRGYHPPQPTGASWVCVCGWGGVRWGGVALWFLGGGGRSCLGVQACQFSHGGGDHPANVRVRPGCVWVGWGRLVCFERGGDVPGCTGLFGLS